MVKRVLVDLLIIFMIISTRFEIKIIRNEYYKKRLSLEYIRFIKYIF